jgi:hypothetical protein
MSGSTMDLPTADWSLAVALSQTAPINVSAVEQAFGVSHPAEYPLYIRSIASVLSAAILLLGTIGNVLVPLVIFRSKELRNTTNYFLINLSVADLLVIVVCMPTVLIELHSKPEVWVLGAVMCKYPPSSTFSHHDLGVIRRPLNASTAHLLSRLTREPICMLLLARSSSCSTLRLHVAISSTFDFLTLFVEHGSSVTRRIWCRLTAFADILSLSLFGVTPKLSAQFDRARSQSLFGRSLTLLRCP